MNKNGLPSDLVALGSPLPNWSITPIFGETAPAIEDYLGKPLLLLIFSLGCPGCLGRAIPYANRMVYEHGERINVLGIHTDFEGVDFKKERFEEAREEFHFRFPFFKDKNYNATYSKYDAGGTPHWLLVDKNGILVYSIFGSSPNNALLRLDLRINELFQES